MSKWTKIKFLKRQFFTHSNRNWYHVVPIMNTYCECNWWNQILDGWILTFFNARQKLTNRNSSPILLIKPGICRFSSNLARFKYRLILELQWFVDSWLSDDISFLPKGERFDKNNCWLRLFGAACSLCFSWSNLCIKWTWYCYHCC